MLLCVSIDFSFLISELQCLRPNATRSQPVNPFPRYAEDPYPNIDSPFDDLVTMSRTSLVLGTASYCSLIEAR